MNLGTNATHAMECTGGQLSVSLSRVRLDGHAVLEDGDYACLTVRDTGVGMSPEVRDRIFDPFFTTKPTGKGSGLGLSVVHGIVRDHGGGISVESTPGGGSVFTVLLPFSEEAGFGAAEEAPARDTTHGLRVAVVDDDPMVLNVAQRLLERLGCDVLAFSDADTALERLGDPSLGVHVVITDQSMPRRTGLELADALRRARPGLPIVLATGFADVGLGDLEAHGVARVLQKPFTEKDLANVLRGTSSGREPR
jgi:CheY-like chemotaxis protein